MYRFFAALSLLLLFSCGGEKDSSFKQEYSSLSFPHFDQKKYEVKSGLIVFETLMRTRSVNIKYKTIVYFDFFGMVERRDTYENGKLQETFLSNGKDNYNISHTSKVAVRTGNAYKGTESKFGWNEITDEEIATGKITKDPPMIIAGKKCKVYSVKTGVATATFAGWKGIILMNKVESEGGISLTKAQTLKIVPVNPVIFQVPAGYKVKG